MSNRVQFDNLVDAESYIRKLEEEIENLKEKIRVFSSISQCHNPHVGDGPILCAVYFNSVLGSHYHSDLEKKIVGNWYKGPLLYSCQLVTPAQNTHQPSDFPVGNTQSQESTKMLAINGRVEYFYNFCVDSLGIAVQECGDDYLPLYKQPIFTQVYDSEIWSSPVNSEGDRKRKQPRSCWNCGSHEHSLKQCPQPKNYAKINSNRSSLPSRTGTGRYHRLQDERFDFKPGSLSAKLLAALGLRKGQIPEYIYRMREKGYPPGYKLVGRHWSGMSVYSEKSDADDHKTECRDKEEEVLYPGFNAPDDCYNDETDKTWNDMEISDEELEEGELSEKKAATTKEKREPIEVESESDEDDYVAPPKVFAMDFPPDVIQHINQTSNPTVRKWKSIRGILKRERKTNI